MLPLITGTTRRSKVSRTGVAYARHGTNLPIQVGGVDSNVATHPCHVGQYVKRVVWVKTGSGAALRDFTYWAAHYGIGTQLAHELGGEDTPYAAAYDVWGPTADLEAFLAHKRVQRALTVGRTRGSDPVQSFTPETARVGWQAQGSGPEKVRASKGVKRGPEAHVPGGSPVVDKGGRIGKLRHISRLDPLPPVQGEGQAHKPLVGSTTLDHDSVCRIAFATWHDEWTPVPCCKWGTWDDMRRWALCAQLAKLA